MHRTGDLVALADREHPGEVGTVHRLHDHALAGAVSQEVGQEVRHRRDPALADDAALPQVQQGAADVRTDEAQATGHQDHRALPSR